MIYDLAVIGAGAAGLFCAGIGGQRGQRVAVLDHRHKVAEKIRISGGGRCNFTNIHCQPEHFLSNNPHFAKSALAHFSPDDFLALVDQHNIAWHEKKNGQLFCDNSAQDIIDMLLGLCQKASVSTYFGTEIRHIRTEQDRFIITAHNQTLYARHLVVATGGLSIPKIGATGLGYDIARQFGLKVIRPSPALVPLTFSDQLRQVCARLTGLSVGAEITTAKTRFHEDMLFTHRGLSGPAILQISSYWQEGAELVLNLVPHTDIAHALIKDKKNTPRRDASTALAQHMPKRLAAELCQLAQQTGTIQKAERLADMPDKALIQLGQNIQNWHVKPAGTEGYRTAEVTKGGVDTDFLSSKDMRAKSCKGLYFIGEVVDVTGHLGGHNFQWAWASAYAVATQLPPPQ